jgi:hypothetical protein
MSFTSDSSGNSKTKTAAVAHARLHATKTGAAPPSPAGKEDQTVSDKFIPMDLTRYFTAAPADFGPRERAIGLSRESRETGLISMPRGTRVFRGIPFLLGPEEATKKCWVALSSQTAPWSKRSLEIPLDHKASFICLAQFRDWDPHERSPG